jgi:hypothetical protein
VAMDGSRIQGALRDQIARERARRAAGKSPDREFRPILERPVSSARHLLNDAPAFESLSSKGVRTVSSQRMRKPPLPKALLGALQSTRRSARSAAGEARRNRLRQFPLLVIGDQIGSQLERFQLVRERPNSDEPPCPDSTWRDATEEARSEHLEHRQFGGETTSFRDFAKAAGYEFRTVGGATRVGYWNNPNAKWERWEIGGQYASRLRVVWRDDALNQARFGDLDFAAMRADSRKRAEGAYNRARRNPAEARSLGVDLSISRAEYVLLRLRRHPLLSAAIVKNGEWFETNSDLSRLVYDDIWARTFDELVADIPTTSLITIVDCQI